MWCAPWTHSGVEPLKRFTETSKWRDPWFSELSSPAKLLWLYLCDICDNAGVIDLSLRIASFDIGATVNEKHLAELKDRVQRLPSGKLWIPKFVGFQYGILTPSAGIHRNVIALLKKHGITYPIGIPYEWVQEKEKEKVPVKVQVQEGESAERGRVLLWNERDTEDQWETAKRWLSDWTKSGADYTELETRGAFLALQASGWMWGRNPVTDPRAAIERQIQTDRERKQRNGNSQPNNGTSARNLTGAQQRQVGQCQPKHDPAELADLLAKREAKRTRDYLAEKAARAGQPPAENSGNGGQG